MFESGNANNSTWLSLHAAANLLGISSRTVKRKIASGELAGSLRKEGKGKPAYYVELTSLPSEAQNKYESERSKAESRQKLSLSELKGWQRDLAFERLEVLSAWERFAEAEGQSMNASVNAFVEHYRETNPDAKISISRGTLFRWRKTKEAHGPSGLAPAWTNGREAFSEGTISPEAKALFLDLWLDQSKPCVSTCFTLLKKEAREKGWVLPSYSTFKRIAVTTPQSVKYKLRYGNKKFEDRAVPYIERDIERLRSNEIWVADHHQLDVAVRRHDGTLGFPWLTMYQDVRSRKIVGFVLVSKPSSDSINICLHNAISEYGVPAQVLLDNGKDFKSRWFTGEAKGRRYKIKEDSIKVSHNQPLLKGIYGDLGIKLIWAIPYNAKAKQIESYFNVFERDFGKFMPGYRGRNTQERPERLKAEWREARVCDFDEIKEAVQRWVNFYNEDRPHTGKGMSDRPPDKVYFSLLDKKRAVRDAELSLLFASCPESKTVKSMGIYHFRDWYFNANLVAHNLNRKVFIRYSEDNVDKVYVFDEKGKYLCIAEKQSKGYFGMPEKDFETLNRKKKNVREATKTWEKENIGPRISPKQRMELVTSQGNLHKTEPVVEAEYVSTKFSGIVAEEKKRELEERRKIDAFQLMQARFNPGDIAPDQGAIKEEAQKFLENYWRQNER
jgi:putative transposase